MANAKPLTKSKLRVGAKHLVSTAAAHHNLTFKQVINLYKYTALEGTLQPMFFICAMSLIWRAIEQGVPITDIGLPSDFHELVEANKPLPDPDLDRKFGSYGEIVGAQYDGYDYLYQTINLVLATKAKSWKTIPGILQRPKPKEEPVLPANKSLAVAVDDTFDPPGLVTPLASVLLPTKNIPWNEQQLSAFSQVHKWLRTAKRKQVFRLYGWAGTGKTEMSKEIANFVYNEAGKRNVPRGAVLYTAYTGKACSVLRSKGCYNADTLHSLLYKVKINEDTGIIEGQVLNQNSPIREASLVVLDEGSFVNNEMADDLLSFGIPVLVLGDPDQLPPPSGEGSITDGEPDVMLTDIRRQAKDNPIIYLATRAREGRVILPGNYGSSIVYPAGTFVENEMLETHDQVLVGTNNTRKSLNRRMRRITGKGDKDIFYPVKGDRLICLKNNRLSGLYNGTLWTASQPIITKAMVPIAKGSSILRPSRADVLAFKVRGIDEIDRATGKPIVAQTQCSLHRFNETLNVPEWRDIVGTDHFDFGYAITVHKGQGSQYDEPLLIDESSAFRDMRHRHLYTGISRAAERISIILTS